MSNTPPDNWHHLFYVVAQRRTDKDLPAPTLEKAVGPCTEGLIRPTSPPQHRSFCGFILKEDADNYCKKINEEIGHFYSVFPVLGVIPRSGNEDDLEGAPGLY